jgi:hypothetical protein
MLTRFKRNIVDCFIGSVSNTLSVELSGTVTVNSSCTTVTGTGTSFTSDFGLEDRIFIGSQSRQVVSIANDTLMTVGTPFSTNAAANVYQRGKLDNNGYYVFAARQSPYENDDIPVSTIDNDYEAQVFIHDELMFGRKITGDDVVPVITKKSWQANTIYDIYDDKDTALIEKNFYVITFENKIYKCIYNNNGGASTIEPSHTQTGFPPAESDGYRWLYLYNITNDQLLTFGTDNYIPVFENEDIKKAAIDGSIFNITVVANGSGYPAHSGVIGTTSNSSIVKISDNASTANDFFSNCAITITNDTTNYTYVREIRDYVSNNSGKYVIVKIPFSNNQILIQLHHLSRLNLRQVQTA